MPVAAFRLSCEDLLSVDSYFIAHKGEGRGDVEPQLYKTNAASNEKARSTA
jgi:hypothetical protein